MWILPVLAVVALGAFGAFVVHMNATQDVCAYRESFGCSELLSDGSMVAFVVLAGLGVGLIVLGVLKIAKHLARRP